MQRLEVSGAVRPIYRSLGFKGLNGRVKFLLKSFTHNSTWSSNIMLWLVLKKTSLFRQKPR